MEAVLRALHPGYSSGDATVMLAEVELTPTLFIKVMGRTRLATVQANRLPRSLCT